MRLLVIEDDKEIAEMLRLGLESTGNIVDYAADGREGLAMAQEAVYSVIILDIMLPKVDGWGVCKALRQRRDSTPILMLTARDSVDDRIRGLDSGADDYLPKPFAYREFLARVRSLARRDQVHKTRTIRVGNLEIDTVQRRVTRGETEIGLSDREYTLLEALASQEGRVVTRETIQERVWMNGEAAGSSTVDVYIGMLRKKIDAGQETRLIHTVHGVGFTLRLPSGDAPQ